MTNFNSVVPVTETAINGTLQQTVSAKQLHAFLNVGRDFSTWFKDRAEQYGLSKGNDYLIFDSPELVNQSTNNDQPWKTKRGGDRRSTDYILTIGTAKELAMIENNEHGRAIRKYFIRCEEQLKQIAPAIQKKEINRLKARIEVASYSKPMCDALVLQRLKQGKETYPKDYTNEFNMINRIVLGTTASKYRKAYNLVGDIRDHLNESTLYHLAYLERSSYLMNGPITVLIHGKITASINTTKRWELTKAVQKVKSFFLARCHQNSDKVTENVTKNLNQVSKVFTKIVKVSSQVSTEKALYKWKPNYRFLILNGEVRTKYAPKTDFLMRINRIFRHIRNGFFESIKRNV